MSTCKAVLNQFWTFQKIQWPLPTGLRLFSLRCSMDFDINKIRYDRLALFVLHTVETMCRTLAIAREKLKALPLLLIVLGFASTLNVVGANYYIDFASGSDNNNGTSAATPWVHCPGDKAALGISAATALKPGDKVFFKGGV